MIIHVFSPFTHHVDKHFGVFCSSPIYCSAENGSDLPLFCLTLPMIRFNVLQFDPTGLSHHVFVFKKGFTFDCCCVLMTGCPTSHNVHEPVKLQGFMMISLFILFCGIYFWKNAAHFNIVHCSPFSFCTVFVLFWSVMHFHFRVNWLFDVRWWWFERMLVLQLMLSIHELLHNWLSMQHGALYEPS